MLKELERSSSIIFVLSMGANLINYIFQIVMGRMLSVTNFGIMNTCFSIFMFAFLPSSVFALAVSKYTAELSVKNEKEKIPYFIKEMFTKAGIIGIIVAIVMILLAPSIRTFLAIDTPYIIELLALAIGLGVVSPVISGGLQGLKKFINLGLFSIITATVKLLVSIILVFLGFSLYGIMGALIISACISIVYGALIIKKHFKGVRPQNPGIRNHLILRFILISLTTSICLAVFTNIDMIMIKHFFSETEAGLYSSAMQFGKILLYVPNALVMAMFPIAAEENTRSGNSFPILKKSMIYCGLITIVAAVILNLFPQFFIGLLFGTKYLDATQFILPVCLMTIPLGLSTTIMNFSLAINRTKFLAYSMIAGCVTDLLLIYFVSHTTIFEILWTLIWVGIAMLLSNIIYLYVIYSKQKKQPSITF